MKRKLLPVLGGILLSAILAAPIGATSVASMNADQLAAQAEVVFVGQVVAIETRPTINRTFAFTDVTFVVDESLKGGVAKEVFTLRLAGGTIGDQVVEVVGMPSFQMGDRYVVFAQGNGKAFCPVLGWNQGFLRFVDHPTRAGESALVDATGSLISGVEKGHFRHAGQRLEPNGSWRATGANNASETVVLWQEGVEVSLEDRTPRRPIRRADAPAADETLTELRQLIEHSRKKAGAHPGLTMPSAEFFEIPKSPVFRPTSIKTR